MDAIQAAAGATPPLPAARATTGAPARPWVVLFTLTGVYVLNFLDRQLLGILAKPIQDSLHISDSQLGLIGGLYFALFYCFIAIPVGWLADRSNRVHILSIACAIWSAATMGCGLAGSYSQLVTARLLVGFGEAGGVPPSYAIIAETFPAERRGMALGIYNMGPAIGAALGIAFGASIAVAFSWRYSFISIGAVGVVAALLVLALVREPERGRTDRARAAGAAAKAGFVDTAKMFFSRPTLLLISLGGGATQFITYGLGNFATLFLMREKGMQLGEVAIWYALNVAIGMGFGILVSGRVIDRYVRRSKQAYALIPALSLTCAVPFYLGFLVAPDWPVALALLLGPMALNYFYLTSSVALVQAEVRPNQRVMSSALLLLIMNFIGLGLGPTYVGAASDWFRASHPSNPLQMALLTLTPFYLLAIFLFLWLARLLKREALLAGAAAQ